MKTLTSTFSKSYHTTQGIATVIPRPSLRLVELGGKMLPWHGSGFARTLWVDKLVGDRYAYFVEFACGNLVQFDPGDLYEDDGRRWVVDFDKCTVIEALPDEVDLTTIPAFIF